MRVENKLAAEGLDLLETSVCLLLETHPRGLTSAQIEQALELKSSGIEGDWQSMISAGVLNRLVNKGAVRKEGYVYLSTREKGQKI